MTADLREHAALLALLRERPDKMSWPEIALRVLTTGSAVEVWEQHAPQTLPLPGEPDPLGDAERDLQSWRAEGMTISTLLDDSYPTRLAGIHQAPPILFSRGELRSEDPAVSVVGSRDASPHGLRLAQEIAERLVREDITVLSGLAAGIDTTAHTAALAAGGRTVAIIGTGLRRAYPATNRALQDEIARRGLVLSQFWPDAPPNKYHFPMRNATMSGYGLATVVVEAGEHSGARIQARLAVEHGRPVILSDLVVHRNSWAKSLLSRPGVKVARDSAEVLHHVWALGEERREVDELVRLYASV